MKKENKVVRSYVGGCTELSQSLKEGWLVKFITPIGNGNTLEYILEREVEEQK